MVLPETVAVAAVATTEITMAGLHGQSVLVVLIGLPQHSHTPLK